MKYLYNAVDNMFYPYALQADYEVNGNWPASGVDVDESTYVEFHSTPPEGMTRIADPDGNPAWGKVPHN